MTTLTGHLTATNKKHIKHLVYNGFTCGVINRITYFINKIEKWEDNEPQRYEVSITQNITNWCELTPRITTDKHTFTL